MKPFILQQGYRQYDLVQASVNTWDDSRDLAIRLILPHDSIPGPYPVVVYVHGGGFIGGSPLIDVENKKDPFSSSFRALLNEGFAVASVGYRLAREAGWPAPIADILSAMRFLHLHGENWDVKSDQFGLIGHSAGARIVALLGMVPQDAFHRQDLPWGDHQVSIAATLLWAGTALSFPELHNWEEFGKPRDSSVPRLHFGEHPAHYESTRHRLRIRNNAPHLSMALPPLHMVRGDNDYGGDHRDAMRAVHIWQKLGAPASLAIHPGGHNTTGPPDEMLHFMHTYLRSKRINRKRNGPEAARILLEIDEPILAIEVLNAHYTENGGTKAPKGKWIFSSGGEVFWLPDHSDWSREDKALAWEIRERLATIESRAAEGFMLQYEWTRALESAENAIKLSDGDKEMQEMYNRIKTEAEKEKQVFESLAEANRRLLAGEKFGLISADLKKIDDARLKQLLHAYRKNKKTGKLPVWARHGGIDLYGVYADLDLGHGHFIRFRRVEPGTWDLPEALRYRNHVDEPFVSRVDIPDAFWLAEAPLTIAQWQAAMGESISDSSGLPVTGKNYLEILDWLQKASSGYADMGMTLRLPTEQEWLHAATKCGRNDVQAAKELHAAHAGNIDPQNPAPLPVYSVLPDLGGFYGFLGGVQEWTSSPDRRKAWFTDEDGRQRIFAYPMARGGAWSSMPQVLGFHIRHHQRHTNRQDDLGFRPVIGEGPGQENWLKPIEVQ
ncbi:MAG: SUMF1/EgtB/PvdO family nonheme iron enzyme [Cyclobacteriaceae bacterium]|nr:SUMF1/EgtB/PvdO family nonheme iron enzyme [Cyclobacteriaceae bacterium]